MKVRENIKEVIHETLDFVRWQVDNDRCTAEEIDSLAGYLLKELNAMASLDDIATYFGQSKSNVLSRRLIDEKDKERVTRYRFGMFLRAMPTSWMKRKHNT